MSDLTLPLESQPHYYSCPHCGAGVFDGPLYRSQIFREGTGPLPRGWPASRAYDADVVYRCVGCGQFFTLAELERIGESEGTADTSGEARSDA